MKSVQAIDSQNGRPPDGSEQGNSEVPGCLCETSPVREIGVSARARLNGGRQARPARIALYSHDTMGLGHSRRNLLLAQALTGGEQRVDVLLITGNRESAAFPMPDGVECLTLPSIHKATDGTYRSRKLGMSLQDLVVLRGNLIRVALESFEPNVLIVDNVPRGAARELDPVLTALRQTGNTLCVLGLRDVLDAPEAVEREWARAENFQAIRHFYDRIWIFGDPAVFDPVTAYSFPPDIAAKVRYAGYLDQRERLNLDALPERDPLADLNLPPGKLALCMVGGGQDGSRLAEIFAGTTLPEGMNGVIVTGPFMPVETRARLQRRADANPRLGVLSFIPEPGLLMDRADLLVTMGGYNTVCDVLSYRKRALIVPRMRPREEQLIRANRLQELGYLEMCRPDDLTPTRLARWLASKPETAERLAIDLQGTWRLPGLLDELMTSVGAWNGQPETGEDYQYAAF